MKEVNQMMTTTFKHYLLVYHNLLVGHDPQVGYPILVRGKFLSYSGD
jgi:hypothetical protein